LIPSEALISMLADIARCFSTSHERGLLPSLLRCRV
jgi:hypothetical protein